MKKNNEDVTPEDFFNENYDNLDPDKKKLIQIMALIACMSPQERKNKYKSASITNERYQPIILTSDEKFENHFMNTGNGIMGFPTKMIPYIIASLQKQYDKNGLEHFEGDLVAWEAHKLKVLSELDVEYFDLSDCDTSCPGCGSPSCGSGAEDEEHEIDEDDSPEQQAINQALNVINKLKNSEDKISLTEEERLDLMEQALQMRRAVIDASKKLSSGNLSPEEMEQLKSETDKKILANLKEVEAKLSGKVENKNKEITIEHLKNIYEKHGEQAAAEELLRVPEDKRDEMLQELMKVFKKK